MRYQWQWLNDELFHPVVSAWLLITPSIAYLIKSGISIGIPNLIIPTIIVAKIRYLYGLTNCKYRLIHTIP